MKRLLFAIMALLFVLALPFMTAMATDTGTASGADGPAINAPPDTFFSWESIGTIPGAIAAVVLLVQVLKLPLDRVWKIPTQVIVFVLSIGILLLAQAFVPALGGLTLQTAILCFINGSIVALSAMSTYELTINRVEARKYWPQPVELLAEASTGLSSDDVQEMTAAEDAAKVKAQTSSTGT
jgi:hypothetical protein